MELVLEADGYGANKIKDLAEGKKILDVLEKYYPGHDWFVNCCHQAGTATVQLMYEGRDKSTRIWKYGFVLHLNKLDGGNIDKKVCNAGGEVLERYNMARGAVNENSIIDFFKHGVDAGSMVQ